MYISLRHEGKIELGIVCNTLASIQRMKNIFSDFHSQDKGLLIEKLGILDDDFKTTLEKKSQLIMPKHQFMKLILKYNQILWMKKTSRCCLNELKKF